MIKIVRIQLEIILLAAVGYMLAKKGMFSAETRRDMTNIVIYVMLPCSIFRSFQTDLTAEVLSKCAVVLAAGFGAQLVYLVLNPVLYRRFPERRRVIMQYATICNNAGFMGLPVIEAVYGGAGVLYGSIALIPIRLFMWTAGLSLFTKAEGKSRLKELALHPCIWAVILGVAHALSPWKLPAFASGAIGLVADCTTAVSIIVVGTVLYGVDFRAVFEADIFYFSVIRLIAIPAVVFGAFWLVRADPVAAGVCVLSAGMPAAMTTAMLSQKYGGDSEFASKIIFVSTLLSLVTLPLISAALKSPAVWPA